MSLLLGDMLVRYKADVSDLTVKTAMATGEVEGFSSAAKLAGLATAGAFLLAGAAVVGFGAISTKMAADFEQSTNLLITSAGETTQNIGMIRTGLLQMSVDTATSTSDLVKGMFNVESAGYHGAAALLVEKAAAEGAKVENADLAATTDVLTTSMHNYHLPVSQAVDAMNSFRLSASLGKMHMDDLTGALRNVLPIASQAGVRLTDVEAALSTMSLAGDKGAMAGTHLQMMLTQLLAPSGKASKALQDVGLTTQQVSDEMKISLPGAVQMITDAVGKKFPVGSAAYLAAVSAIVGGSKSMKAIMELSGVSLNTFIHDASALAPTMKANSTAVDGWNVVQSNFNFKMDAAKNAVGALMITLGGALLPVLGRIVSSVTPVIAAFTGWLSKTDAIGHGVSAVSGFIHQLVDAFNTVFGSVQKASGVMKPLTDSFDRATGVFHNVNTAAKPLLDSFDRATGVFNKTGTSARGATQAINPFIAIFQGVANAIRTGIAVFNAIATAVNFVHNVFMQLLPTFQKIGAFLVSTFKPVWDQLVTSFGDIQKALKPIMPQLTMFAQFLGGVVVVAIVLVISIIAGLVTAFAGLLKGAIQVVTGIIQFFTGLIQFFSGFFSLITDLFSGHWGKIAADLNTMMTGIMNMFLGIWNVIAGIFSAAFGTIQGFASGFVSAIVGFFQMLADKIVGHSIIPDMVNSIVNWFQQLPGRALGAVQSLLGNLAGFFGGLASQAITWGSNIIQGLINGIASMAGNVTNAIGNIVGIIASHLPHSPAKMGPLRDLTHSGEQITNQLSQGMLQAVPKLQTSLSVMLKPMTNYPIVPSAGVVAAASSNAGSNGNGQTFILEVDGVQLAKIVNTSTDRTVRLKLGSRGRAP